MKGSLRKVLTSVLAGFALLATSGVAQAQLCLLNCGFTVSGKKGPFLPALDPVKLAQMRAGEAEADGKAKGVGDHTLNKGELNGFGLAMPETQRKLQALLAEISDAAAKWPNLSPAPKDIPIHIIASTVYPPQAQPDNTIVIPFGLLIRAQSKDEVAWLLAHEYSHIALGHFARDAAMERRRQLIDTAVNAAITGLELSRLRSQGEGQHLQLYAVNDPEEVRRAHTTESLQEDLRLSVTLHGQLVSREQEDQADAAGADIAIAAGWDADDGASAAFTQIQADDDAFAKGVQSAMDELKSNASQSLTKQDTDAIKSGQVGFAFNDFVKSFGSNIGSVLEKRLIAHLETAHRATDQRRKGLHAYIHDAYPNFDSDVKIDWINALRSSDEYKQSLIALTALQDAKSKMDANQPKEALLALAPAEQTPYARAPFIADKAAEIYAALGDVQRAYALYDLTEAQSIHAPAVAAVKSHGHHKADAAAAAAPTPPAALDPYFAQSLEGYEDHVSMLVSHSAYAKAKLKIAEAKARFGDDDAFLPDLIFMAVKAGKLDEMQAYLDQCRALQDEGAWERCKLAIYDESQKDQIDKLTPAQRDRLDHALERQDEENSRTSMWKSMVDSLNKTQTPAPTSTN